MHKNQFLEYLSFERRVSTHTVTAYKKDVEQFELFLNKELEISKIEQISSLQIRSWIASLMEEGISARSINRKISSVKTYFKFLIREGVIQKNPTHNLVLPKISKRLPVFVEKKSMDVLLDELEFPEGFEGIRDRLILEFFYSTGMRLSELIELKNNWVDEKQLQIKVLGKRNKERIIPITRELAQKIVAYKNQKKLTDYFFETNKGEKLYGKFVYRVVNTYLSKITTVDKKSPHVLRHTFATHMLNNGADLNSIKELLGHANLSATEVYTHNTFEKLKNIYKQAHPRA